MAKPVDRTGRSAGSALGSSDPGPDRTGPVDRIGSIGCDEHGSVARV